MRKTQRTLSCQFRGRSALLYKISGIKHGGNNQGFCKNKKNEPFEHWKTF